MNWKLRLLLVYILLEDDSVKWATKKCVKDVFLD